MVYSHTYGSGFCQIIMFLFIPIGTSYMETDITSTHSPLCALIQQWWSPAITALYTGMHAQLLGCMSSPGSSVHGILQAGILEWVAFSSSRGSSQPRHQTCVTYVSCIGRHVRAPPGKPILYTGNSYEHFTHFKPLQSSREYQRLVVLSSSFCR